MVKATVLPYGHPEDPGRSSSMAASEQGVEKRCLRHGRRAPAATEGRSGLGGGRHRPVFCGEDRGKEQAWEFARGDSGGRWP